MWLFSETKQKYGLRTFNLEFKVKLIHRNIQICTQKLHNLEKILIKKNKKFN